MLRQIASLTDEIGKVDHFFRLTAPKGYKIANGEAHLISTIVKLAAFIYCGDSNNATASYCYKCTNPADATNSRSTSGTYIVLPDLRGNTLKGLSGSRIPGHYESDNNKIHDHNFTGVAVADHQHGASGIIGTNGGSGNFNQSVGGAANPQTGSAGVSVSPAGGHTPSGTISSTGSTEVTVKNIAALPCIRYI